jgi:hypothetical protein
MSPTTRDVFDKGLPEGSFVLGREVTHEHVDRGGCPCQPVEGRVRVFKDQHMRHGVDAVPPGDNRAVGLPTPRIRKPPSQRTQSLLRIGSDDIGGT